MSGETKEEVSGWTVDTLRLHIEKEIEGVRILLQERYNTQTKALEAAFDAQRTAMEAALASAEKAVGKAEVASEKRFDSVNEFRGQLADQAMALMPRTESNARHDATGEKLASIESQMGARLSQIEVALSRHASSNELGTLERGMQNLASRREVGAAVSGVEEKVKDLAHASEKRSEALLSQVNVNALAIERVNAAGQTIYVLRAEAAAAAKNVDDRIIATAASAINNHKLVSDQVVELRAQLGEQATKMMPRLESETRTMANTERLREIEIRMQSYPSRDETAVALSAADAKFAAGIGSVTEKTDSVAERLAALDLRLSSRLDLSSGKSSGYSSLYGWLVAGIGLLVTVIILANSLFGNR